jgi:hypothetical protein
MSTIPANAGLVDARRRDRHHRRRVDRQRSHRKRFRLGSVEVFTQVNAVNELGQDSL